MANATNSASAHDSNKDERWLPVLGYEGVYEVSDLGRVRTIARVISRAMPDGSVQHQRRPEKIMRQATHGGRWYPRVTLCVDYRRKTVSVHTLVLEAFSGPAPEGCECRHLDGDFGNSRLSNLEWGTPDENQADKHRHGTILRGEQVANSVLSAADVRCIRKRYAAGERQYRLAEAFGVSKATICRAVNGGCWAHVL